MAHAPKRVRWWATGLPIIVTVCGRAGLVHCHATTEVGSEFGMKPPHRQSTSSVDTNMFARHGRQHESGTSGFHGAGYVAPTTDDISTSPQSASATPPFVPWVFAAYHTMALGHSADGSETVPYLGSFPNEVLCRSRCTSQPNCTEYVWNNSTDAEWRNRCYGRHDSVWDLSPSPNSFSGRRVSPEPGPTPPPTPPPPPPVPPGVVTLLVLDGRPVDPHYFGWNLESWGQDINLTYSDAAGLAYTKALHTGVLRYPGIVNPHPTLSHALSTLVFCSTQVSPTHTHTLFALVFVDTQGSQLATHAKTQCALLDLATCCSGQVHSPS
jgi:hypothetical protein